MSRQALQADSASPATEAAPPPPTSVAWRALTLLELLSTTDGGLGVREAARRTGIDRSAVSRLLTQFEQLGFAQQNGERGVYSIGARMYAVSAAVRAKDTLWNAARPIVEALVAQHNEACYLTVRDGRNIVFREKVDCDQPIRYVVELGRTFPLTSGAAGTAVLSALPEPEIDAILADGFERYTDASFATSAQYRAQLEIDRAQGFSFSMGRWVKNGAGVASPFFDSTGAVVGALTLSCPADRIDLESISDVGSSVRDASRRLSRRLGYLGAWGPQDP